MTKHDFSELESLVPALIADMPTEFSSHKFILKFAQQHQHAYIRALNLCLDLEAPFQRVHKWFSDHLKQYPTLLQQLEQGSSRDIFGHSNTCAFWKKLS
ncbi:MAG: hypothetical protein JNJ95_00920 [Dechloromonas sp.]|nr:hypothetical protein [Dechloromonas sp.]